MELPEVGKHVKKGETFGVVESVKVCVCVTRFIDTTTGSNYMGMAAANAPFLLQWCIWGMVGCKHSLYCIRA